MKVGLGQLLGFVMLAVASAEAQEVFVGAAEAIAADRIMIDGQQFSLFGIDAVEMEQVCFINGQPWSCGAVAFRELEILVDEEGPLTCTLRQAPAWVTCTAGEMDIAEMLVRRGMALAVLDQSEDYVAAERSAESEEVGAWQGIFEPPWEYRERMERIQQVPLRGAGAR